MAEPDKPRRDPRFERLTATPELFLKDFNPERDLAVLSPMSEASYRDSVFMDDRLVRSETRDLALSLNALGRLWQHSGVAARAIHYIGHMGHCGSTLLSRVLGELPGLHSLREPPVLVALSRALRHLETPGFGLSTFEWSQLLELAALMMQRTWRASEVSVVKPTSAAGNLLPYLMNRTGDERAVLLYVHLADWLPIMLRPDTRRETRLFAKDFRLGDFAAAAGNQVASPASAGELAAMTWLLQAREFTALLDDPRTGARVRLLHFDTLLDHPVPVIGALCEWFGKPQRRDDIAAVAERLMTTDAKRPGQPHGAAARAAELQRLRATEAMEIERGLAWARDAGRSPAFSGLAERLPPATASPGPAPEA
jgi:hypothetical protein